MVDRESGPPEDDAPVPPPIPSFDSLRAPRRRSAVDLLLPPAEPTALVDPVAPVDLEELAPAAPRAPRPAPAPRPAEWADLLRLGAWLGGCLAQRVRGLLRG
ncbi:MULTISPECIES: hypothetical protein [unclassified Blastococcus]